MRRIAFTAIVAVWLLHALDAFASQYVRLDYNLTLNPRTRSTAFIELFDDKPLTQANFMHYVNGGMWDGTFMHRLARGFVIQGGGFYPELVESEDPPHIWLDPTATVEYDTDPSTPNPMVPNEYNVGTIRSNLTGTIAMAKQAGNPNSATNQWFVNLKNNSFLDLPENNSFTVFAQVLGDGMTLFNAFNTLSIANLNPDLNGDGTRDGTLFGSSSTDGVPFLNGSQADLLVIVENADRIDYYGNGQTLNVPSGGVTFSTRDSFIDTGMAFTGSGALNVAANRTLGIREWFHLTRPLVNYGTVEPGLQLGAITVKAYRQEPGASLEIQLGGTWLDQPGTTPPLPTTSATTPYDRLIVTDGALLGGNLEVSLLNGFVPAANNSFTILTATQIVDDFANINLPLLSPGLVWDVDKTLTTYTLSVAAADFNRDGVVDAGDYIVWSKFRGTTVPTAFSWADANGDFQINDLDYDIWRHNLGNNRGGNVGGGASYIVPEPSGVALFLMGLGFLACRRQRSMSAR
jgi:cyclophilin family peptidyl-prolyl cis-trans isomerase